MALGKLAPAEQPAASGARAGLHDPPPEQRRAETDRQPDPDQLPAERQEVRPHGRLLSRAGKHHERAGDLETAVREVSHHQSLFLTATREPAISLDMRCYRSPVRQPLHDIRGAQGQLPDVYARDDYRTSQRFGAALRESGSWGIVYDSVRDPGGECVGIFRPRGLGQAIQGEHIALQWNGEQIESWYVKSELHRL